MAVKESELLRKILAEELSLEEEKAAVEGLMQRNPQTALSLVPVYVQQKHRHKAATEATTKLGQDLIEQLRQPPWHPARFLCLVSGAEGRALVVAGSRRLLVSVGPFVNPAELHCGRGVALNHDMNVLLTLIPDLPSSGSVGVFSHFHDGRAVLKGAADEELVVEIAQQARESGLKSGDRLLYDRESLVAWERVDSGGEQTYLLEETPDVTFEEIGGLEEIIEEITTEVTLHFRHRSLVAQHRLQPAKGVLLCGPPGCGKTMIAKALANHLARMQGAAAKFFNVKPGVHRSMWYGQTEEKIRELFVLARKAAAEERSCAVLFFDDVDHLGNRGDGFSTALDTRVLPAFLHEIDGLEGLERVLLIGATNRPDLLDEALLRPGRFGDKVFRVPRPNREAARDIFRKHLAPELPYYHTNGAAPEDLAATMIETTLAALYAPNGEQAALATLTFRDGSRRSLTAPQVMSGALIANVVAEAKRRSCLRAVRGGPVGLATADLLTALDRELGSIAQRLRPGPALQQLLDLPADLDVVKVEAHPQRKEPRSFAYLQ
jgi:proteasome-associated ATPase